MLYKYSAIFDIDANKYEEVKRSLDYRSLDYNTKFSSLEEMSIKEQLKFYINKYLPNNTDRARMIELVDKL